MIDKRTLENRLLFVNLDRELSRLNQDWDSSLIDTSLAPREAKNDLKRKYPYLIVDGPKKDDFLSVNNFIYPADLRNSSGECLHCRRPFKAERSTGKYCSDSCRFMAWRKRQKMKKAHEADKS